jgi:ATP-dependent Clp protease ATP-binding subunit ClpA
MLGQQPLQRGDGVAAAILERLGVHHEHIRAASHRLFGPPAATPRHDVPPMSTEAICALDAAAHTAAVNASDSAAPEIRTEHLLGVLALDPGSRARRVLNELQVDIAAVKRELQCHITVNPTRPARWWKRRPATSNRCSFCGQTTEPGGLVSGPSVTICRPCITLAASILAARQPTESPS